MAWHAPGIAALAQTLQAIGDVTIRGASREFQRSRPLNCHHRTGIP
jgi:hypothetical protein